VNKSRVIVEAPAKINICLAVKSRRSDGYHEIESLMHKVKLADRLYISLAVKGIRLTCSASDLPEGEANLAYRAARIFFESTGVRYLSQTGVDIVLEKKIPVAAGLGGGSSDAAAVIRGLNDLFETNLNLDELVAMARLLGADVPFFVSDYAACRATGIGECLEGAAPLEDCWILLVNPGFPVSTKWVYENLELTSERNTYNLPRNSRLQLDLSTKNNFASDNFLALTTIAGYMFNDLEAVTVKRYPQLGDIKEGLLEDGAVGVLMSGSGPTVFGLFSGRGDEERNKAARSYKKYMQQFGDNVFLTRPYKAGR